MRASPSRAVLALILAASFGVTAHAADAAAPAAAAASQAEGVSPAFAAPFNAAQDLLKAGKGLDALAKLKEIEALPNQTPYEKYLLLRVRAPAEYAANDAANAAKDFETLLTDSHLPASDRLPILKALASVLYSSEQYLKAADAIQRYLAAGGDDAQIRELLPQTYYLAKDYPAAAKAYRAQVDATYAAGKVPTEKVLRLLASSYSQANDDTTYLWALEHLAVNYPKPEYWKELVGRAQHAEHTEKLSDRQYVDGLRLKATLLGDVSDAERLGYAQLAQRAGYPAEAKKVLDEGLAKKGFPANDQAEATKLRDVVNRSAAQDKAQRAANEAAAKSAKDGNALVSQGFLEVLEGDTPSGLALIQQGIAKGSLKFPDEARLHLGIAQYRAAQPADALASFKAVPATSNLSAIAHVWALYMQSELAASVTPAAAK